MTAVVIGIPAVTPPDPGLSPGWERIRSLWTGWDGSVWDLTNPEMGVFLRRGGVRGLGLPAIQHYRDELNTIPGSTYRGTTYRARDVFWPVHLFHDGSSREFVERDDQWWSSLHPRHLGTWTVEVPGVSKRSIDLRLEGDDDWAPEQDPVFFGWAAYGVRLLAEQPLWRGEPVRYRFEPDAPLPFFGGTDVGAPILNISSGTSLATASVTNRGDEPGWGIWTVHGPNAGSSVAVDGKIIEIPFALAAGEWVRLDSRPSARTAYDQAGVDRFSELGAVSWGAVPAGGTSSLDLVLTGGTGFIEFEFDPLYLRAWGVR